MHTSNFSPCSPSLIMVSIPLIPFLMTLQQTMHGSIEDGPHSSLRPCVKSLLELFLFFSATVFFIVDFFRPFTSFVLHMSAFKSNMSVKITKSKDTLHTMQNDDRFLDNGSLGIALLVQKYNFMSLKLLSLRFLETK